MSDPRIEPGARIESGVRIEPGARIEVVLFDLDGVIRFFRRLHRSEVEARHGVPSGRLAEVAFDPTVNDVLVTGGMSFDEWRLLVGERVGNQAAADEWLADRGHVDHEMLAFIDRLRAGGHTVAILTNGTDTVEAELAALGVIERVDRVFNSWRLGVAKPDPAAFRDVCAALAVDPSNVLFTDDTERKLSGAIQLGMATHHFTGMSGLVAALQAAGVEALDAPRRSETHR